MTRLGADPSRLLICLAGGARLLNRNAPPAPPHEIFQAAIQALDRQQLRPQTQHLTEAGDCRCSLGMATGEVCLKFSGQSRVLVLWKSSTAS